MIEYGRLRLNVTADAQALVAPYLRWFDNASEVSKEIPMLDGGVVADIVCTPERQLALSWRPDYPNPTPKVSLQVALSAAHRHQRGISALGGLGQAIGRRSKTVLDATGGWGQDSILLWQQGLNVVTVERHPLLAMLLHHAYQSHLAPDATPWLRLEYADVRAVMSAWGREIDCVYFDPMFAPKRKKSAKSNKYMQFNQALFDDRDAESTLLYLLDSGARRVVVKRPPYADPLVATPDQVFAGKLICYDLYLRH